MSTLVTGVGGTGKTAFVVNELKTRIDDLKKQRRDIPTIYQHGIRELLIPHVQVYCRSDQCLACREVPDEDKKLMAADLFDYINPGDIAVIDECQRIWPARGPGRPLPAGVAYMETHRHFGAELFFMSQHPSLFDSALRKHFRRHLHVEVKWNGRKLYEWDKCSEALKFAEARERPYKLPSEIFGLYKSAEAHIEIERKKPLSLYVAVGALSLGSVGLGAIIWRNIDKQSEVEQPSNAQIAQVTDPSSVASAPGHQTVDAFPDFKPEIEGVPESAPAYRPLLKVQSVPTLAGCVKSASSCVCYTHQATRYPTSREYCEETIKGNRFDPYAPPSQMSTSRNPDILPANASKTETNPQG